MTLIKVESFFGFQKVITVIFEYQKSDKIVLEGLKKTKTTKNVGKTLG